MVRIFRGFFAALFLLVGCSTVWAQATPEGVQPSDRAVHGLIVRSGPSASSTAIGSLLPGTAAIVIDRARGWVHVRLADGTEGYVSSSWVSVFAAPAATPTPATTVTAGNAAYTIEAADVGTGLAILITGPSFAVLYDGGSNDDYARGANNRLVAFIKATHPTLRHIDHVILSHPHRDHVELLPDVIDTFDVGEVWEPGRTYPICGYRAFVTEISKHPTITYHDAIASGGTHVASFDAKECYGKQLSKEDISISRGPKVGTSVVSLAPGATITFLYEDPTDGIDPNLNSIVARVDLGSRHLLLVGDAPGGERADPSTAPDPTSIEGQLLSRDLAQLKADILVAGHHGSETSSRSSFINAVGATQYIISSGPMKYGTVTLPDRVIENELTAKGQVWKTYLNDAACKTAQKVGRDADGQPGGCDNVRIVIDENGGISAGYEHLVD